MQGIEINRRFFAECGEPQLDAAFPKWRSCCTAGMAGGGSECLGYDDEVSVDHDFEAGFCLWIDRADEELHGFSLMRAYSRLPKEFCGVKRRQSSALGCTKYGVMITEDFFLRVIGLSRAPSSWQEWLYTPEQALVEASSGEIFFAGGGSFSGIRAELAAGYPRDVMLKKLSGELALAAQSGQYNFDRCIRHGEAGAAQLAVAEYAGYLSAAALHLCGRYAPYYKWRLRALSDAMPRLALLLTRLLISGGQPQLQSELIEQSAQLVIEALRQAGLTEGRSDYLEPHAFSVAAAIRGRDIAGLHIMETGR